VVVILVLELVVLLILGALTTNAASITGKNAAAHPAGLDLRGGCTGTGQSFDRHGVLIGEVTAPGSPKASPSRALLIDPKGRVQYRGGSLGPITNHHWSVSVVGVKAKSGGSANTRKLTTTSGSQNTSGYFPFKVTGLYYVSGGIAGTGGACRGDMWVKITGSPVGTAPWIIGLVLVVIGLLLILLLRPRIVRAAEADRIRRHPITGFVAGLLIGIGVNLLLIVYSIAAYRTVGPAIVIVVGMAVIGVVIGTFGPPRVRLPRPPRPPH
ncbi:MAG TPA: hypothetical protein VKI19_14400, partial [Acidimicrobiales bacterium]|nr:hypothetical protein [Acidimicrobiales bacterium]